jgi:hypothetical protein
MKYNILIISFLILIISCNCVSATWWEENWLYRQEITLVGNTSGAQTDYQLLLNITYDSDMQSDFDGLRFCNETHELDSWLESKVDDSYALVWVEFQTTPANGVNQTYYMYYGNAGAASDWSGPNTFLKFDDFEDALQGDWTTLVGTIDYANTDHAYGGTQCINMSVISRAEIPITHGSDIAIRFRLWKTTAATFFFWHCDGSWSAHTGIPADEDIDYYNGAWQDSGDNLVPDQWELIEFRDFNWTGCTYDIIHNSVSSQNDAGMWNYNRHTDKVELENSNSDISYIDNFIIRKYAANPPTYVFGSEEYYTPPTPTTIVNETKLIMSEITTELKKVNMGNYLVYAFILLGILLIILSIQIITNNIYRR